MSTANDMIPPNSFAMREGWCTISWAEQNKLPVLEVGIDERGGVYMWLGDFSNRRVCIYCMNSGHLQSVSVFGDEVHGQNLDQRGKENILWFLGKKY